LKLHFKRKSPLFEVTLEEIWKCKMKQTIMNKNMFTRTSRMVKIGLAKEVCLRVILETSGIVSPSISVISVMVRAMIVMESFGPVAQGSHQLYRARNIIVH